MHTRTGHGFTDLDAARHMYAEFVGASLAARHVVRPAATDDPSAVAGVIETMVRSGVALVAG